MSYQNLELDSNSWSVTNFLKLMYYNGNTGTIDWWSVINTGTIFCFEALEAWSIKFASSKAHMQGLPYTLILKDDFNINDPIHQSYKSFVGMSMAFGFSITKNYFYSNLITQYATPNSYLNFINEWQSIKFENNTEIYTKSKNDLASGLFQSESGTYQFGNIMMCLVGGVSKIFITLNELIHNKNWYVLAYNFFSLSSYYLNMFKINELFDHNKETSIKIRDLPKTFHNITNTTEEVEVLKYYVHKVRDGENELIKYKVLTSLLTSGHNIFVEKSAFFDGKIYLTSQKDMDTATRKNSESVIRESSFLVKWTGDNLFRWVDIVHRMDKVNEYFIKIQDIRKFALQNCSSLSEENMILNGENQDTNSDL